MPDPTPPPDPNAAPPPADPSADATLDAMTNALAARLKTRIDAMAGPTPSADAPPAPSAAPAPTMSRDELVAKCAELTNAGRADEAFKLALDYGQGAMTATNRAVMEQIGRQRVETLSSRYGDSFTKRRAAYEAEMKRRGLSFAELADGTNAEDLFAIVLQRDPTYEAERKAGIDAAIAAAHEKWKAEQPKVTLSPTPLYPSNLPDDTRSELTDALGEDPEFTSYAMSQINAYGIPLDAFLRQARKTNNPLPEELDHEGGKFRSGRRWIELGGRSRPKPPAPATPGAVKV